MNEKFEPGVPGLVRNAVRQLAFVLVNVPLELMYRPSESTMPISTRCIAWSSSARPLMKILPSENVVPSVGVSRDSFRTGGVSPG